MEGRSSTRARTASQSGGGRESNPPTGSRTAPPVLKTGRDTSPHSPPGPPTDIACDSHGGRGASRRLTFDGFLTDTGDVKGRNASGQSRESGFSLIELLVVIVIIAILAAIGIPIFLNQREKAYVISIQSTLKNAANFVESQAVDNAGDYSTLDDQDAATALARRGLQAARVVRGPRLREHPG